tara:strand:+ start:6599 stop:7087 length:489 start_codon:yes stop_codon:yes gene_type:complete
MNNLSLRLLPIILLSVTSFGCKNDVKLETRSKTSDTELEAIIKKQVDSLYSVYERFDYDWIEFYADNYTAIYPNSPVQQMTKDSLKAEWERIYVKYDVKLIDRGNPSVIVSEDMAISYNSFNEIFINKKTSDTLKNVGTYIINWKRQPDDSWKIVFETLQNN